MEMDDNLLCKYFNNQATAEEIEQIEQWLAGDPSRLEYPPVFAGKERRVKLSGEGLFNVVHDASHPFIVEAFASEIEVLGTTFNVFTDEEHSRFSTTLAEGKVRVTLMESGDQLTLRPDEMAIFENGSSGGHPVHVQFLKTINARYLKFTSLETSKYSTDFVEFELYHK